MASSSTPSILSFSFSSSSSFFFFILFLFVFSSAATNDTATLIMFRSQTDSHGNLLSNWTSTNACASWSGVKCNIAGRVIALSLPSLNLRGPINSLSQLDQLRLLNLYNNRLNGTLLPITNCTNLKLLYLSKNEFTGEVPPEIGALKRLVRLDISNNNLQGPMPPQISNLTRLITARFQNNMLYGQLPDLSVMLPKLRELNLSNNKFYGRVPEALLRMFGEGSFMGNEGLCGLKPWPKCSVSSDSGPLSGATAQSIVPSNPSSIPVRTLPGNGGSGARSKLGTGEIVAIVAGNASVLIIIGSMIVVYKCRRSNRRCDRTWDREEDMVSKGESGGGDDHRNKLVFFDKTKAFELEELLRASAEMLGKGNLGTVYKAMLENGCTFAVKRLKDANPCSKKEFEHFMDLVSKIEHPNLVCLKAYYYAKEEKLLVYDYLPNGSLHSLLHGNRGPGRIPLDWTTRLGIILGAARGLARIHEENHNESKIPHGNVKSTNVLVDKDGVACISDFGLALLISPIQATARLGGYRAPEQEQTRKLSQKADVYSFGVLLLEVLTGRAPSSTSSSSTSRSGSGNLKEDEEQGMDLPKWVRSVVRDEWTAEVFDTELLRYKNIEEEMVALLHVAMACVAENAEKRPSMGEVAKMIGEIRVVQSPLGEDFDDSCNSRSPSLAVTEDSRASC